MPAELERNIERKLVRMLRDRGALVVKLNLLGQRSWPDRLAIAPNGAHCWIEVKRPGGKPTQLQRALHLDFKRRGVRVWVVSSVKAGLKAYVEEKSKWQDYLDWKARR